MYSEKTPDDGQRNCPKRVEYHSKNKFEKLVHLVGFIVRKKKVEHLVEGQLTKKTLDITKILHVPG